jgi:PTH1 family peptidyl-tRNA hydrolase
MSVGVQKCLIAGLGNPGKAYDETRHNIGFLVVREFAQKNGFVFQHATSFIGEIAQGKKHEKKVILLLPLTYMNSSGEAIRICKDYFEISPEEILIVCDDIALPYGKVRLRPKGSSGGHNGLKSVEAHLGTQEYGRLRVGIGEKEGKELTDHVLGRFTSEEKKTLPKVIEKAADAVERWLSSGIESAMRTFNVEKSEEIGE